MRNNQQTEKQLPHKLTPDPDGTTFVITLKDMITEDGHRAISIMCDPGDQLKKLSMAQIVGLKTMDEINRSMSAIIEIGKVVTRLNQEGKQ
ncbi:MAG: hypothetical protein KHX31_03760 [Akkermansia sp.]|uniref:hypothetical protein n=1 Tax=Akkermansia sp. TaxID=1872421 RepID=UPI0025BAB4D7|nr:hypothetical protein [Akkermansia sp.]MBS5507731.1 hypothetical protein [Akkermansia sp.]